MRSWNCLKPLLALAFFLLIWQSIGAGRLLLSAGDSGSRFFRAAHYAMKPSQILQAREWAQSHPPVPAILQAFLIRQCLDEKAKDLSAPIQAVQLAAAFLTLAGFLLLSSAMASQGGPKPAFLFFVFCFGEYSLLKLSATAMAEPYAFFFVAGAVWVTLSFVHGRIKVFWPAVLCLWLATYSRNETFIVVFPLALYLSSAGYGRRALAFLFWIAGGVLLRFALSFATIPGEKFYEMGKVFVQDKRGVYFFRFFYDLFFLNRAYFFFLILVLCLAGAGWLWTRPGAVVCSEKSFREKTSALSGRFWRFFREAPECFWFTGFLFTAGILFEEILRGNSNYQDRFLFLSNIFLKGALALLCMRLLEGLPKPKTFLRALGVVGILLIAGYSLWTGVRIASGTYESGGRWGAFQTHHRHWQPEKEVIAFLKENLAPREQVAYDELASYDIMLSAYTVRPAYLAFSIYFFDRAETFVSATVKRSGDPVMRFTARKHAYLHAERPRYLVLFNEATFRKQRGRFIARTGITSDFFRKYLTRVSGTGPRYRFRSPYVFPGRTIDYGKVFENSRYIILEKRAP
ncbi:MAG: hypothetical protein ACOY3K_05030 [Candidatus Omnitrophota bacterium]